MPHPMSDALNDWISRHPGHVPRMRGASQAEIEALEKVAGHLPSPYKLFLAEMGRGWPEALKLNPDLAYDVVFKLHYARFNKLKRKAADPKKARLQAKRPRDPMLVIAPGRGTDPHDVAIDVDHPDHPVYEISDCCETRLLAKSLRDYIFGPR